jgi:pimeloyl-ACP methyl ester carboxylesterase
VLPEPTTAVTLADGRIIAADDVGDPGGVPVVYLHGAPDCRLARHPDDDLAVAAGARLLAVDRPGYGWTDVQPGRPDVVGWGVEVASLLDTLGIERCRIVAWSAGAHWAFGTAAALADRVEGIATYAALAPFEAFADEAVAAASGPRARIADDIASGADVDELARDMAAMLVPPPPVDPDTACEIVLDNYGERSRAEVGAVPGALERMALSLAAAVDRHGDAGLRVDLMVQFSPGIAEVLAQIACEVVLVHGHHDPIAGPAVGEWLASRLPSARVEVWAAGHQGLLPRWSDLLRLAASS